MRILIVEDEHKIAQSLKKGLEQENFAVDLCFDGIKGFDLASTEEYDAIILDLMLPGLDGITICQNLRSSSIHTPILILTAKGQTNEKVEGLNSGADDYLAKPFAFEEVLARVKALTRRPAHILTNTLSADDLTLDTQSFEVKRGKTLINLSSKEFSLLEYLLRNKNKILTKDKIIEHVWSYDSDVLPNTVEVYMGYLRSKIDKPFSTKPHLLKTVRGFGYKLEDKSHV